MRANRLRVGSFERFPVLPEVFESAKKLRSGDEQMLFGSNWRRDREARKARLLAKYGRTAEIANLGRQIAFQEILSRPSSEGLPLAQQEYFELRIEEFEEFLGRTYSVKQLRTQWSDTFQVLVTASTAIEFRPTLQEAKELCEDWRKVLISMGFTESDMDF
jgi:hypothetical protein